MKKSKKTVFSEADLTPVAGSFRDPAGWVMRGLGSTVYRVVAEPGQRDFETLTSSGLSDYLIAKNQLVSHEVVTRQNGKTILLCQKIPVITYPFEWSFSQLKDAALLTLAVQKVALRYGMSLKDASAYNVQFLLGAPIFIDTLSFEKLDEVSPWVAYQQFCQHFLAPLALMSYVDKDLLQLMRVHIDGVPLPLASKLLPARAKLRPGLAIHIAAHARAQVIKASDHSGKAAIRTSHNARAAIIDSLERTVRQLFVRRSKTEWADYYDNTNYSVDALDEKARLVSAMVKKISPSNALDLGGNTGRYSRLLADGGIATICADIDPNAVEANYVQTKRAGETNMLPVLVDLTNPGGGLGWANGERESIVERFQTDLVLALALVHHLAISNNLPLESIARYFAGFGDHLIIEFVPKEDSQVQKLLTTRKDIFPDYTPEGFEKAFRQHYRLAGANPIKGTSRILYHFARASDGKK